MSRFSLIWSFLLLGFVYLAYLSAFKSTSERYRNIIRTPMAALQPLKYLTVAARAKHTATVIFVHGLGDTGYGWQPVATMFGSVASMKHIKWILPHAPEMRVTLNNGAEMPSWFDIASLDPGTDSEDEQGMLSTVRSLNQIITEEVDSGIPAHRIVIGGFSQGGAMSLLTGMTSERKLGGVVVMSGWLPLRTKFKAMLNDHARKLPIFWGHGKRDPVVRYQWADLSVAFLRNNIGIREATNDDVSGLEFHAYNNLMHSANDEEIDHLQAWLEKVIPEPSA